MDVDWLVSDVGQAVISEAMKHSDSLEAVTTLRKQYPQIESELISQAVTQAGLHSSLASRWGDEFTDLVLTKDGIEQATRPSVAKWRAKWIQEHFGTGARVLDMTCGLGFDALAMAQAGLQVSAIERDPITAACARHNLARYSVSVTVGDCLELPTSDCDVLFIDPMRRDPDASRTLDGSQKRIFNPELWSPNWSHITELAKRNQVVCKVAPGIDDKYLQEWETIWLSADGDVVEAMAVSNGTGNRSALVLQGDEVWQSSSIAAAPIMAEGEYLIVPDGAITRAGALAEICELVGGGLVNEHIGWIVSDDSDLVGQLANKRPKLADVFQIVAKVKADEKAIARTVKVLPASAITIMTRGIQVDVPKLRKRIAPSLISNAPELIIGLYRQDGGNQALICRRIKPT
ncbi:MAG: hypothetical protein EBR84_00930 [Actinobacteria bacterium]|nr:hypothetical protein [Actinomycetota bacterium]